MKYTCIRVQIYVHAVHMYQIMWNPLEIQTNLNTTIYKFLFVDISYSGHYFHFYSTQEIDVYG